jgi:hypothetical protein
VSFLGSFVQLLLFSARLCALFAIAVISSASYALPQHLINFDNAKNALRTALGQNPVTGPLSVITVTRTPLVSGPTELISHEEFRELLKLLYPLCSGRNAPYYSKFADFKRCSFFSAIPGVDCVRNFCWRVAGYPESGLNDVPVSPREIQNVNDMCQNLKRFHDRYLRDSCNILVFNEMFFSQADPLTVDQKDFINDKLFELSQSSPFSFFYPNYLYTETRSARGHTIHSTYRHMERAASRPYNRLVNVGGDSSVITDCGDILRGNVNNDNNFYNQEFLVNETYGVHNGRIVTKYKKKSYFNESNDTIRAGAIYDYGAGRDIALRGSSLAVRTALLSNISTEICFDLAHGIRSRNNWDNGAGQSALHILQSNCIDPFYTDNIGNLPADVPIIYADSCLNYQKCGVPFCHDFGGGRQQCGELPLKLCGLTIGDSMYTMSVYSR